MGRVLQHPTAPKAWARAAAHAALDRQLASAAPQDGWTLGLAGRWPEPLRELAFRVRLLELWREELRAVDLGPLGAGEIVDALRSRAQTLRHGPTAHALGTARLVRLLERTADALADDEW